MWCCLTALNDSLCIKIMIERSRDITATIVLIVVWHFPFTDWAVQWDSWSDTHAPPAVLVGISAGVSHAPVITCSSCWLAEGPGQRSRSVVTAATEWVNTQGKKAPTVWRRPNIHIHRSTKNNIHTHTHTLAPISIHSHTLTLQHTYSARAEAQPASAWSGDLRLNRRPL